jgi:hypothetical protein
LAGRRGELLFQQSSFCLRAGIDELAYALLAIMPVLAFQAGGDKSNELYPALWNTTLAQVDETLLTHSTIVRDIAARLMRHGSVKGHKLNRLLAPVPPRSEQPRIRALHELQQIAHDPLAYAPAKLKEGAS